MNVELKVLSFERMWLDLFLEFDSRTYTLDYEWRILRSEGPAGPWEVRTPWVKEVFHYRDNVVQMLDRVRQFYYVLEVKNVSTAVVEKFGPAVLGAKPDLIGMEIIRQVRMELRFGSGRVCYVVPKRTVGPRCRSCFDQDSGVRMRSNCISCFDTGRAGGFYSPIITDMDISEADRSQTQRDLTNLQQVNTSARMTNFPPVKVGDIIVTPENDRYRIERSTTAEHRGAPYEQDLLLHLIPRADVEYKIPISVQDLASYEDSLYAEMRSIPTTLDGTDDSSIERIIGYFGDVKI